MNRLPFSIATDAEIKSGGQGMEISWGLTESPFGKCFIAQNPHGISHLSFFDEDEKESLEVVRKDWLKAELRRDDKLAIATARSLFALESPTFHLHLKGTDFQLKVWNALLGIPKGELSTYGRLANQIGMQSAARAIGNAVGRNRISYLIPCHRVVRECGAIGGYHWGVVRKRAMLAAELAVTPGSN